MSTRRPAFKETQVFTWESEPADERPSEFANSAFMSAAPHRPARRSKPGAAPVLLWIVATLCASSLLLFGVAAFLQGFLG